MEVIFLFDSKLSYTTIPYYSGLNPSSNKSSQNHNHPLKVSNPFISAKFSLIFMKLGKIAYWILQGQVQFFVFSSSGGALYLEFSLTG